MGLFDSSYGRRRRKERIVRNNEKLAKLDKEINESKEKKEKHQSDLEKKLIEKYGSYDKIPDYHRKYLDI